MTPRHLGIAVLFFAAALLAAGLKHDFNFVVSDGRGYYVYLPSLVIDHDVDFSNQIREHWGVDFRPELLDERTPSGLVNDRYPIGVALTLAPAFLAAHLLTLACGRAVGWPADGYSMLYQLFALVFVMGLGFITMLTIERSARQETSVSANAASWAMLCCWLLTPYTYYYFREPLMACVISTFWVSLVVGYSLNPTQLHHFLMLGFALGMATICRPTNALFASFVVPVLVTTWHRRQAHLLLGLAAGALPVAIQLSVWHAMSGHWIYDSYAAYHFDWAHPHLWQTLFSSRHGLFLWSPTLLVASIAFIAFAAKRLSRDRLWAFAISAVLLWYTNSSWPIWWFGDSFGGRAFVELLPFFAIGLALLFSQAKHWAAPAKRALATVLVFAALAQAVLLALYISHRISRQDYLVSSGQRPTIALLLPKQR